jgi:hypothetical protein
VGCKVFEPRLIKDRLVGGSCDGRCHSPLRERRRGTWGRFFCPIHHMIIWRLRVVILVGERDKWTVPLSHGSFRKIAVWSMIIRATTGCISILTPCLHKKHKLQYYSG